MVLRSPLFASRLFGNLSFVHPQSVDSAVQMICEFAPNTVTPFNLRYNSSGETAKGVRVGTTNTHVTGVRSVIVASGINLSEGLPIPLSLYVAAALSERPIEGVHVTFLPLMRPNQYKLLWQVKQLGEQQQKQQQQQQEDVSPLGFESKPPIKLSFQLPATGTATGILGGFMLKYSPRFVSVSMELDGKTEHVMTFPKVQDTLARRFLPPPALLIELRDTHELGMRESVTPVVLSTCAEQVISSIQQLVEDTSTAGLVI